MKLPVLKALSHEKYSTMFLGLVFGIVIFVLFSLSIMLIYSLLLLNVDTKRFQFGLLRSLGLSK